MNKPSALPDAGVTQRAGHVTGGHDTSAVIGIVARGRDGCIARDGAVPWRIARDMRHFVRHTTGRVMVMGRKTFDSLPGLLPGRRHIVLTRQPDWHADGAETVHSLGQTFACAQGDAIAVIGGAEIFALFMPHIDRFEITEIDADTKDCDVRLPAPDPAIWREAQREPYPAGDDHPGFAFVTYRRRDDAPAAGRAR